MDLLPDWKTIASLAGSILVARSAIPPEIYAAIGATFGKISSVIQPKIGYFIIEEYEDSNINELFESVHIFLGFICSISAKASRLTKLRDSKGIKKSLPRNEGIEDTFKGMKLSWILCSVEEKRSRSESQFFRVTFEKKYRQKVESVYFNHIMEVAEAIKSTNRQKLLYTNRTSRDGDESRDQRRLKKFLQRKEYYQKVGRAWKRGYLLYGPPGTGKTSLIAAIANFCDYDIYDLELTAVRDNYHLRRLLISTSSKSVIVVEDLDCWADLTNRQNKNKNKRSGQESSAFGGTASGISLSGVLNFVDGLGSSSGGERLLVFTTNHKDHLDPALLRPGRMDKHIHLSYCGIGAFSILAKNYLGVDGNPLMGEVSKMLLSIKITPAEIAEILMEREDDVDFALGSLLKELKKRLESSSVQVVSSVISRKEEPSRGAQKEIGKLKRISVSSVITKGKDISRKKDEQGQTS